MADSGSDSPLLGKKLNEQSQKWRDNVWLVICMTAVTFLGCAGYSIILPSLWFYVHSLHGSKLFLGFVMAAYSFGQALGSPFFGAWGDKFGFKIPFIVSLALELVGYLLYSFAHNKWLLLIARFVGGFGAGNVAVSRACVVKLTEDKYRTRAMSWVTAGATLGFVLGPVVATVFSNISFGSGFWTFNAYNLPSIFSAIAVAANIVVILVVFRESGSANQRLHAPPDVDLSRLPSVPILAIATCFLTQFALTLGFALFETVVAPLTSDVFDWHVFDTSVFYLIMAGIATCVILFVSFFGTRFDERKLLVLGLALMTAGGSMLVCYTNLHCADMSYWRFWLGFVLLLGLGHPFAFVDNLVVFSKVLGPVPQGAYQGWMNAIDSAARCIGPVFATAVYSQVGESVLFASVSAIIALNFLLAIISFPKLAPMVVPEDISAAIEEALLHPEDPEDVGFDGE